MSNQALISLTLSAATTPCWMSPVPWWVGRNRQLYHGPWNAINWNGVGTTPSDGYYACRQDGVDIDRWSRRLYCVLCWLLGYGNCITSIPYQDTLLLRTAAAPLCPPPFGKLADLHRYQRYLSSLLINSVCFGSWRRGHYPNPRANTPDTSMCTQYDRKAGTPEIRGEGSERATES